ncbi:DnaA ATPase domain-containing protein [Succinatimonas hippei]|uniref:AAA+ ATPase domain-containing protein n=1 Tax=Succinatimonas hippei (strain DSM 22608 / JCM 16073 / KCTC 15190 / YIT 12066) TaxID=762983 RepID=E8LIE3_SUCHY|nr:DnaA/Hda family protein [Succinatimonas hippei]EFY07711.1 hypothetical protein HMPREF9444_00460 [Succinatimonas hippei YIT 12066]
MLTSAEYNPELSFSTLLIGHYNKQCYKKLMDICLYPKHHIGEIFLLTGKRGTGKTHLLRAFQNEFKLKHNKLKCGYLDCRKEFYALNYYWYKSSTVYSTFNDYFAAYDVLILDNVDTFFDSLIFKDATIEILRNFSKNKVAILSSAFVADKFHFTSPYAKEFVKQIGVYKRLDFKKISLQEKLQIAFKNNEYFREPLPDNIVYLAASSFRENLTKLKQLLSLAAVAHIAEKELDSEDLRAICKGLQDGDDCFYDRTFYNLSYVKSNIQSKSAKENIPVNGIKFASYLLNAKDYGSWRPSFLLLKPSTHPFSVLEDVHLTPKEHEKEVEGIYEKVYDCYFSKGWGCYEENGPAIMIERPYPKKIDKLQTSEIKKIRSDIEKILQRPIRISNAGIEIPYKKRFFVRLRDVADQSWLLNYRCSSTKIPVCLGINSAYGYPWIEDFADIGWLALVGKDPHTLFISLMTGFLLFKSPQEMRMVNIGQKFKSLYAGLPHLIDLKKGLKEICADCLSEIYKRENFLKANGFNSFSEYKTHCRGENFNCKEQSLPYILVFGEEIDDYEEDAAALIEIAKEGRKVGIFSIFTFKSSQSPAATKILYKSDIPILAFKMEVSDSEALLKNDDASQLLPYGDYILCNKNRDRWHSTLVTEKDYLKIKAAWLLK